MCKVLGLKLYFLVFMSKNRIHLDLSAVGHFLINASLPFSIFFIFPVALFLMPFRAAMRRD